MIAYKSSTLIKLRLADAKARDYFLYAILASADGWKTAIDIIGNPSSAAELSTDQKKRFYLLRKKKEDDENPSQSMS